MRKRTHLYHGTLLRNVTLIEQQGLIPMIGTFTKNAYGENAAGVVPAVFMADKKGLERVVHAMVAAIMDEVAEADFEHYEIGPDYHLNDDLFFKYGALIIVDKADGFHRVGKPKPGIAEPFQAESGDWFSLEMVRPSRTLTGDALREFLSERDLIPSQVNDFVDPESVPAGTKTPTLPPFPFF